MRIRESAALSDAERSRIYYDAIATHYDRDLTAEPRDRLARQAFVDLVSRCVPHGSTILDFGCGTGLDSEAFARLGYDVLAYDSSSGMLAELARCCAEPIRRGQIRVADAARSLDDALDGWPQPAAVVADFAVVNMIADPAALFARFADRTPPDGWLIISVLNPFHWRELLTRRWWSAALRGRPGAPHPHLRAHFNSYLHFEQSLRRAARGYRLVGRGSAGSIVRYDSVDGAPAWWSAEHAGALKRAVWRTPLRRFLGTFVILVMRREG
jgi:SAM-dependent methyltransferase